MTDEKKIIAAVSDVLRSIGAGRGWHVQGAIHGAALPYAQFSYSLAGEDAVALHHFKRRLSTPGTFVDIGCGAPVVINNTFAFYLLGWRGLCIDPNASLGASWTEARPRDTFLVAAVGENPGAALFFRHRQNTGMSMVSTTVPAGDFEPGKPVEIKRLDQLLAHHFADRTIDLMNIDVEGAELGVLRSSDWNCWRPELVIVEAEGFDAAQPLKAPAVEFLVDHGYALIGSIGRNAFMRDAKKKPPEP